MDSRKLINIEDLITLLRNEIEKIGYKCYSPDLPQNDEMCSALSLGQGINQRAINQNILYSEIPVYLLIRGSSNDKNTRKIADDIFNQLDMKKDIILNNTRIILISCTPPYYAFRDENQKIYYNINIDVKIEWRNDQSTKVQ